MYSKEYLNMIKEKALRLSYRTSIPQAHALVLREAAEAIEQLLAKNEEIMGKTYDNGRNCDMRLAG